MLGGVEFTPQIESLTENLNDDATNKLINEINMLILLVAFNCSIYTFIYFYIAMKLSRKPEIKLTDKEKSDIENGLTEFLNLYIQQITKT